MASHQCFRNVQYSQISKVIILCNDIKYEEPNKVFFLYSPYDTSFLTVHPYSVLNIIIVTKKIITLLVLLRNDNIIRFYKFVEIVLHYLEIVILLTGL